MVSAKKPQIQKEEVLSKNGYKDLLSRQNGKCAICGINAKNLKKALCKDHDHITGEIRGLLCCRCNFMLGYARDSFTVLRLAADYLENYFVVNGYISETDC